MYKSLSIYTFPLQSLKNYCAMVSIIQKYDFLKGVDRVQELLSRCLFFTSLAETKNSNTKQKLDKKSISIYKLPFSIFCIYLEACLNIFNVLLYCLSNSTSVSGNA